MVAARRNEQCPSCGADMLLVGLFYGFREQDQKRVCLAPWWCASCDRVWRRWADRPDPLEPDVPLPESIKRRLLEQ